MLLRCTKHHHCRIWHGDELRFPTKIFLLFPTRSLSIFFYLSLFLSLTRHYNINNCSSTKSISKLNKKLQVFCQLYQQLWNRYFTTSDLYDLFFFKNRLHITHKCPVIAALSIALGYDPWQRVGTFTMTILTSWIVRAYTHRCGVTDE